MGYFAVAKIAITGVIALKESRQSIFSKRRMALSSLKHRAILIAVRAKKVNVEKNTVLVLLMEKNAQMCVSA